MAILGPRYLGQPNNDLNDARRVINARAKSPIKPKRTQTNPNQNALFESPNYQSINRFHMAKPR
jgi:hypothetical protein